jgi:hypothetical protein
MDSLILMNSRVDLYRGISFRMLDAGELELEPF